MVKNLKVKLLENKIRTVEIKQERNFIVLLILSLKFYSHIYFRECWLFYDDTAFISIIQDSIMAWPLTTSNKHEWICIIKYQMNKNTFPQWKTVKYWKKSTLQTEKRQKEKRKKYEGMPFCLLLTIKKKITKTLSTWGCSKTYPPPLPPSPQTAFTVRCASEILR